ncbi:DUF418 domain-containing protein [Sphingomonas sp.]|uniref:DUF418 domain-containing protein n=1 Tax=Sphingomonas sp. TaxID=28214 RepID=UPI00260E1A8B|nr:DUF418 domain-containing protein [Sphingomonas sp.]MDF2496256.1 hypothetical protein [Sphingomonas sp.]
MSAPDTSRRIATIDGVRGFAVLGILLLNIVAFAMPSYAYVDPTLYGGTTGANWWVWALTFILADGKMRGLFTMLFGASTLLIADRAGQSGTSPTRTHYARMVSLLGIGLVHAYLIWSGDILVLYALSGAIVFLARRWDVPRQLAVAALLMIAPLASAALDYAALQHFQALATAPGASPAVLAEWARYQADVASINATVPAELSAFRGDWQQVSAMRVELAWQAQRRIFPDMAAETIGLMLLGMVLFRTGFFSGGWPASWYRATLAVGYGLCLPGYVAIAWWIRRSGFDPMVLLLAEPLHLALLRPPMAMAHATLIIALISRVPSGWLSLRLTAAGRMAFTNYLMTSIICTLLFYGYGLGWFGYLERWQLYPIVCLVWLLILLWSKPWLDRFAMGPLEWLWRGLTMGKLPAVRR